MQEFREFYRALTKELPDPLWYAVFLDHHTKIMDQLFIRATSKKIQLTVVETILEHFWTYMKPFFIKKDHSYELNEDRTNFKTEPGLNFDLFNDFIEDTSPHDIPEAKIRDAWTLFSHDKVLMATLCKLVQEED